MKYTLIVILAIAAIACVPAKKYNQLLASHTQRDSQYLDMHARYTIMRGQRDTMQEVVDTLMSVLRDYDATFDRTVHMHKLEMQLCGCNIDSLADRAKRNYDSLLNNAEQSMKVPLDSLLKMYREKKK